MTRDEKIESLECALEFVETAIEALEDAENLDGVPVAKLNKAIQAVEEARDSLQEAKDELEDV